MGTQDCGGHQMNITEFFSMGGYGAYIWSSFGLTLVLMGFEFIYLRKKHTHTVRRIRRMLQLNSRVGDERQA